MKQFAFIAAIVVMLGAGAYAAGQKTGDRVKIGGDVVVNEGETVNDAVAVMGNLTVNGTVEGDATAVLGSVAVGPKGVIKGDAVSIMKSVLLADGGRVYGSITEVMGANCQAPGPCGGNRAFFCNMMLIGSAGFILLSLLFVALFPKYSTNTAELMEMNFLKTFLIGVLGLILIIPVCFMLLISIIGILLIPVEIICVLAALTIGMIAVARICGKKLVYAAAKKQIAPIWETMIGAIVLMLVFWIPFLGVMVKITAATFGFGAVILSIFPRKNAANS